MTEALQAKPRCSIRILLQLLLPRLCNDLAVVIAVETCVVVVVGERCCLVSVVMRRVTAAATVRLFLVIAKRSIVLVFVVVVVGLIMRKYTNDLVSNGGVMGYISIFLRTCRQRKTRGRRRQGFAAWECK